MKTKMQDMDENTYPFFNNLPNAINDRYQINNFIGFYVWITVPCAVAIFTVTLICFFIHIYHDYKKPDNREIVILFKNLTPFFG